MQKKKAAPKKRAYKYHVDPSPGDGLLQIETAPPSYTYRPLKKETIEFLAKVDKTVQVVKPGQCFLIPSVRRAIAKRHLAAQYPEQIFAMRVILDNTDVTRVYLVPKPKK